MRIVVRWNRPTASQRYLFIFAAGLPLFITGLAIHEFIAPLPPGAAENVAFTVPNLPSADLIVPEAAFVVAAEGRRLAGVLTNRSERAYRNIQMTFSLIGANGDNVGLVEATVNRLGGHEAAKFEASGVTADAVEVVVKHIEGETTLASMP